ncbi:molybdenum cofactor guanylyltransferase MobA [Roseiarcaceae bacterium H3SJ34-1]|uniref:molybdenum cofactor guanylyltransferase MobA n=1 Tax=Terripilifer ovatus TaxID=3032367 RepID=UPI003AB98BE1|nr:molybdenum cofactor guanylyltransferase MobA [Roseiarcaceae bacterium H3SJ34-1]
MTICGTILAGGLARRLGGGDKSLREVAGRTILDRTIARLQPHCAALAINANGDPARFAAFGLPVIADSIEGYAGPLAGILAGMDWCAETYPNAGWLVTAPADCPFLPVDFVPRLIGEQDASNANIIVAESGGRTHPVTALWRLGLREALRSHLIQDGSHKVESWIRSQRWTAVRWPDDPYDPFFNINTPDDLAVAETLILKGLVH